MKKIKEQVLKGLKIDLGEKGFTKKNVEKLVSEGISIKLENEVIEVFDYTEVLKGIDEAEEDRVKRGYYRAIAKLLVDLELKGCKIGVIRDLGGLSKLKIEGGVIGEIECDKEGIELKKVSIGKVEYMEEVSKQGALEGGLEIDTRVNIGFEDEDLQLESASKEIGRLREKREEGVKAETTAEVIKVEDLGGIRIEVDLIGKGEVLEDLKREEEKGNQKKIRLMKAYTVKQQVINQLKKDPLTRYKFMEKIEAGSDAEGYWAGCIIKGEKEGEVEFIVDTQGFDYMRYARAVEGRVGEYLINRKVKEVEDRLESVQENKVEVYGEEYEDYEDYEEDYERCADIEEASSKGYAAGYAEGLKEGKVEGLRRYYDHIKEEVKKTVKVKELTEEELKKKEEELSKVEYQVNKLFYGLGHEIIDSASDWLEYVGGGISNYTDDYYHYFEESYHLGMSEGMGDGCEEVFEKGSKIKKEPFKELGELAGRLELEIKVNRLNKIKQEKREDVENAIKEKNKQHLSKYKGQFDEGQQYEIKRGLAEGYDISVYAKPEYDRDQMLQIRIGMKNGVEVGVYAKPEYDAYQMYEIRLGLEEGLEVSRYAKPEFKAEQMEVIREGLEKGLEVNHYAKPEFNVEQMREIRLGLEEGLEVSRYAKPEFNVEQMRVIKGGLSEGLEVNWYAKPCFDKQQMLEIRLGLNSKIDVGLYAKPEFTYKQMSEIRRGLLEGVDVKEYANPEIENTEMVKIRENLLKEQGEESQLKEEGDYEEGLKKGYLQGLEEGKDEGYTLTREELESLVDIGGSDLGSKAKRLKESYAKQLKERRAELKEGKEDERYMEGYEKGYRIGRKVGLLEGYIENKEGKEKVEVELKAGGDYSYRDLGGLDLRGLDLRGCNLDCSNLRGVRIDKSTKLEGVSMKYAHIIDAEIEEGALEGVDIKYTIIKSTK